MKIMRTVPTGEGTHEIASSCGQKVKLISITKLLAAFMLAFLICGVSYGSVVVKDGVSDYQIVIRKDAPSSVYFAAKELQEHIAKATGVTLSVGHDFGSSPIIALGMNELLSERLLEDIPWEGYRIMTRDGSLFIFGPDTVDGERTPGGGFSYGTLNGVYSFLEDYVGVRWLMPGEVGEFVPERDALAIPELDVLDAPDFERRDIPYSGARTSPEVRLWHLRQRVGSETHWLRGVRGRFKPGGPETSLDPGFSMDFKHSHNWIQIITPDLYDQHPYLFAEHGGVRTRPEGKYYKICTANPDVIDRFADAAIRTFKNHPHRVMFSLSPSDVGGWCKCDDCRALDEIDEDGNRRITTRILTFYNEVAEIVSRKFPDKFVSGYVYCDFELPPLDPDFELHPNVFLVWAPLSNYGYTHYRPEQRELWHETLEGWSRMTDNLGYYDLLNVLSFQNLPGFLPLGVENLKSVMPALKEQNIRGVYLYGRDIWGTIAPLNYALAKLSWNADLDIDEMFVEFFTKAYGKGGKAIYNLYMLLDDQMKQLYLSDSSLHWRMTYKHFRELYPPVWKKMEELYREAESEVAPGAERERLELFRDNMIVLADILQSLGMVAVKEDSPFFLPDEKYREMVQKHKDSIYVRVRDIAMDDSEAREIASKTPVFSFKPIPEHLSEGISRLRLRGGHHFIFRSTGDEEVIIRVAPREACSEPVQYAVFDSLGSIITDGELLVPGNITFFAGGGETYHVLLKTRRTIYFLTIPDIPHLVNSNYTERNGVYFFVNTRPLYFHVPEDVEKFNLTLSANRPNYAAIARVYDPEGNLVTTLRAVETHLDTQEIESGAGAGGIWKVTGPEGVEGIHFYDVHVLFGEELSGYASFGPSAMLMEE